MIRAQTVFSRNTNTASTSSITTFRSSNLMTRTPINLLQRWRSPQRLLHVASLDHDLRLPLCATDMGQTTKSARRLVSHCCFHMFLTTILSKSRCTPSNHVSQHQPQLYETMHVRTKLFHPDSIHLNVDSNHHPTHQQSDQLSRQNDEDILQEPTTIRWEESFCLSVSDTKYGNDDNQVVTLSCNQIDLTSSNCPSTASLPSERNRVPFGNTSKTQQCTLTHTSNERLSNWATHEQAPHCHPDLVDTDSHQSISRADE